MEESGSNKSLGSGGDRSPISVVSNGIHRRRGSSLSSSTDLSQISAVERDDIAHPRDILGEAKKRATKILCIAVNIGKNLVPHWELPEWLQDNEFLHYFHRPQLQSFKLCFKSMFSLHSETGNIWTHFLGFLIFTICFFVILIRPVVTKDGYPHYPQGALEYLVFAAFFVGAQLCMMFSWLFHTLSCHSLSIKNSFAQLDYSGIALLITGSSLPVMYYGFYCRSVEKYAYIGVILSMCVPVIAMALWKKMSQPEYRTIRAGLFLTFGLSNIVPIVHQGILMKLPYMVNAVGLWYLVLGGVFYVGGTMLYVFRIPERLFPGVINLIFQSHQIFHILVVAGALLHLWAICKMADYRVKHGRIC